MEMRAVSRFLLFLHMSKAWALACALPILLSACRGSDLSQKFFQGARRQEGVDNNSLYLWDRSPAIASGNFGILSTANLDATINKEVRYFSNIDDINASLRSSDLTMQYSHANEGASIFFKWAGKRVPWKNNSDFRVLFAYNELDSVVAYVDGLIAAERLRENSTGFFAWRKAVCQDGIGEKRGGRSCDTAEEIIAAPVLPVVVSVDNATDTEGNDAFVDDTGFCPLFDTQYYQTSDSYCLSRADSSWRTKWHSGRLARKIMFYRDSEVPTFNFVDDGDVVVHEMAHVVQAALNPQIMESPAGSNPHMDAIIEGSADFFAAAYRRDDQMFRYAFNNLYPLYPNEYVGNFSGKVRDPRNSLFFPDAYSYRGPYDKGRVLSGAMNDYRKLRQGQSVPALLGPATIAAIDNQGEAAWDLSLGLLMQAFYELRDVEASLASMNRFSGKMVEICTTAAALSCDPVKLRAVFENRGLLTTRYFDPTKYKAPTVVGGTDTPWEQSIGSSNAFLARIGRENVENDQATERWGLHLPKELGWMPFRPAGADQNKFANDDNILNPCETIVVFPNIQNNTHLAKWKDLTGSRETYEDADSVVAPFPAVTGSIAGYNLIPEAVRGLDFIDMRWVMGAAAVGFKDFLHPTLGYPDKYNGVNPNDSRGLPFLKAGENTKTLISDQSGRLYKIYQERAFDLPWSLKNITQPANVQKLRSAAGWIFKLPQTPAPTDDIAAMSATLTFKIEYKVYNGRNLSADGVYSDIHYVAETRDEDDEDVVISRELASSKLVTQGLRVSETDAGFCATP